MHTRHCSTSNSIQPHGTGVLRAVATEAIGYQQHVGEYGTHWNFFLTLALTTQPVAAVRAQMWCKDDLVGAAGLLLAVLHEWMLLSWGVLEVVLAETRGPGWGSMNKEGLLSLPGYMALALMAAWAGRRVACWYASRVVFIMV